MSEYIERKSSCCCPVCGSTNIWQNDHGFENRFVWAHVYCMDCDAHWTDYYKMDETEIWDKDSED